MKTFKCLVGFCIIILFIACTKSEPIKTDPNEKPFAPTAYKVLLKNNIGLIPQTISNDENGLSHNGVFPTINGYAGSTITYRENSLIAFYVAKGNCSGELLLYNFKEDTKTLYPVFDDLTACSLGVTSIAFTKDFLFVAYVQELEGKENSFVIRKISIMDSTQFTDIVVTKEPKEIIPIEDKLFVLTSDDNVTDQYYLAVIDIALENVLLEKNLGYNAERMLKKPDNNLVITYPELHSTINTTTLEAVYTNYGPGTDPKMLYSDQFYFDGTDKMYYKAQVDGAVTPNIPAMFDFSNNLAVLYFYENFLSEAQLNVQINLEKTTTLAFDVANNEIIIGYEKKGGEAKGGLIRITPSPELTFIDFIALDGIPYSIYVNQD